MKKILYCIIPLLYLCACSSENKELDNQLNLQIEDSLVIQIPDSIVPPRIEFNWNYYEDVLSYLFPDTGSKYSLYNYNISKEKWSEIKISKEGPNGVGYSGPFKKKEGTIYYFPSVLSSIFQLDTTGKIKSKINYDPNLQVNAGPSNRANFIIKDSVIYFESLYRDNLKNKDTYDNTKIVGVYDFRSDSFSTIINYPEEFRNESWSPHDIERNIIFRDNKVIVNFSKSHSLYVYDYQGNLIKKVVMRHSSVGDATGRGALDPNEQLLKYESTGSYSNLLYDSYRKLYYRIANFYGSGDVEIKSMVDMAMAIRKRKMAIITFNESFEKLAVNEFDFQEYGFVDDMTFVNEKGLHIKTVKGEHNDERLNFSILTQ